ncbi:pilus assembly protein CpaE [Natronincola peptidivorans]|uniref:Stage 0 sporulation protein A homolog n=1 Tax=Natronincola peptidivorans TaxID=426128 RepID=A0A1I0FQX4_9FIRM|nr:response regulator [Natronincola peptidivorans]SET59737.1 pilus assembly protein CpaE [Natronincola peptidivorans]
MDKIRVLIADDIMETQGYYGSLLSKAEDIQVVGEVTNGEDAIKKTRQLLPDIIIMDLNMSMMNGIAVTEKITLSNPDVAVIMVNSHEDFQQMKKAMLAGARDCLIKPFQPEDLLDAIRRTYQIEKKRIANFESVKVHHKKQHSNTPQIVTVFGTKGGVGKTTLSVNMAVEMAKKSSRKILLIDLDLQFGDAAIFLNILPKKSIAELAQEKNKLDISLIESYLVPHVSGIKLLPAPLRPEDSELITSDFIMELLTVLRDHYDYIIIDTPPLFHDTVLSALDMSNQIVMVMSMDLPAVKNMKLSLDLLDTLHYKGKIKLILNRASEEFGITPKDVEETLDFHIANQMPSDGKLVVRAANRGVPFVMNKSSAKISRAIEEIAQMVAEDYGYQKELKEVSSKRSGFKRLFS